MMRRAFFSSVNPLEDHIQLRDALFRLCQHSLFLCQRLVTLPQAPFRRPLDKVVLILRHIGDRFPQVPQYDFFQHYTADGVRLAQGTVFSIGGADIIFLLWLEVVGPAKVHLAAAIGAVHQPGERFLHSGIYDHPKSGRKEGTPRSYEQSF